MPDTADRAAADRTSRAISALTAAGRSLDDIAIETSGFNGTTLATIGEFSRSPFYAGVCWHSVLYRLMTFGRARIRLAGGVLDVRPA